MVVWALNNNKIFFIKKVENWPCFLSIANVQLLYFVNFAPFVTYVYLSIYRSNKLNNLLLFNFYILTSIARLKDQFVQQPWNLSWTGLVLSIFCFQIWFFCLWRWKWISLTGVLKTRLMQKHSIFDAFFAFPPQKIFFTWYFFYL